MISVDFENFKKNIPLPKNKKSTLIKFLKKIEKRSLGFYDIKKLEIAEKEIKEKIKNYKNFTDIVLLGIGGSALGAKAIKDSITKTKTKNLYVLDNTDPTLILDIRKKINLPKTLFLVMSKSGGTIETLSQFIFFHEEIKKQKLDPQKHFLFVTGEKTFLTEIYPKEKYEKFLVPENIGGRFSVLTPIGLIPAELLESDTKKLLRGAEKMAKIFLEKSPEKNVPFLLASAIFECHKRKKNSLVLMPYANELKTFGEWCVQLIAESTGKRKSWNSSVGITPIPAIGATDQHSQLQLFADGPKDKSVIFFEIQKFKEDIIISKKIPHEKLKLIESKSFGELINAEFKGTRDALTKDKVPNITIKIKELTEESLGELFMLFMGVIAFLGEFLKINAFDQPGVERSKTITKEYLKR